MKPKDFRTAIADYIREQAQPVDKFSHQPRLYELARQIGADETFDDDILFAAAWMHDLGVFIGHRPEEPAALATWDMIAYAVVRVPEILKRLGFPVKKIPAVIEIIKAHQPSGNPASSEGVILRDADMLEQLGAAGILRTACKIGRDSRFKTFPDALRVLQQNADTLPAQLRLPSARRLAEPRLQILRLFLAAAENEQCSREQ